MLFIIFLLFIIKYFYFVLVIVYFWSVDTYTSIWIYAYIQTYICVDMYIQGSRCKSISATALARQRVRCIFPSFPLHGSPAQLHGSPAQGPVGIQYPVYRILDTVLQIWNTYKGGGRGVTRGFPGRAAWLFDDHFFDSILDLSFFIFWCQLGPMLAPNLAPCWLKLVQVGLMLTQVGSSWPHVGSSWLQVASSCLDFVSNWP